MFLSFSKSLPEPAAASPEKPHVLRAPRSPAARCAVRAADTSHLPTGKRRGRGVRVAGVSPSPPNFSPPAAVTSPRQRRSRAVAVPAGGGGGTGRRALALGGEGQGGSGDG